MPEAAIVTIGSLWIPIVLASVLVFFASAIVWMVLPHHKNDWGKMPDEEGVMATLRNAGLKPGQYAFPNCGGDMKAMKTPEFQKKMEEGPVGLMCIGPNGPPNMGKSLGQWFVYTLLIGVFVAYLTGRMLPAGEEYMTVFRMTGTTAFLAYCMAIIPNAIWKFGSWGMVFKEIIDGFVYALLTAGAFSGFWPDA